MKALALFLALVAAACFSSVWAAESWVTNRPMVLKAMSGQEEGNKSGGSASTKTFDHYLPGSLNNLIWTNLIGRTNGKSSQIWAERAHPEDWPKHPPTVRWNTNSLIWGMAAMTALSPCWEDEGGSGQVPITALTRRHGYTRGHDMGADGFASRRKGKKVWFVSAENKIVEVKVKREVVRTRNGPTREDYTILLFDRDLPDAIQPMRVTAYTNVLAKYPNRPTAPWPIFKTEQSGNVSADIPAFTINTWKGGDSGSPDMLPMPGELVFFQGRSTSGPSKQMQADMDALCRLEGLRPEKYQLQWIDLSAFPSY
jgi:hypothetical protein